MNVSTATRQYGKILLRAIKKEHAKGILQEINAHCHVTRKRKRREGTRGGARALSGPFLLRVQAMRAPPLVLSLRFLFLFRLERGGDMGEKGKGEEKMDVLTYEPVFPLQKRPLTCYFLS